MAITEKEGTETTVKLGVYIIHGGSSCRRIYGVWSTIVHRIVKEVKVPKTWYEGNPSLRHKPRSRWARYQ